jgi:signal transduction histidine kinase
MVHQAQVLREAMAVDANAALEDRGAMLARITEHTGMRLRLVDTRGQVVSDSGGQVIRIEERPEIRAALAGRYGSSARFAPGRRRLNLFAALPLRRGDQVVGVVYGSRSTAGVTQALMELKQHLIRVFSFSVGISIILTLFLAATISRPVSKLAQRADRIAKGDTVVPLALGSASELGELAKAFERMRLRLQGRADDNAAMAADISHEFKSPLTSIRGAAELLQEGAAEDPEVRARFLEHRPRQRAHVSAGRTSSRTLSGAGRLHESNAH